MNYTTIQTQEYFKRYAVRREKLHRRNRYYYSYVESLVRFLTPDNKKVLSITSPMIDVLSGTGIYDYVTVSDALGYIYDIENFFKDVYGALKSDGRVIVTQYSALWEPILRLASHLGLRMPPIEQNWISSIDLNTFLNLAGFEVISSGSKMLCPVHIPIISYLLNAYVANIFPFNKLGLIHYAVARKASQQAKVNNVRDSRLSADSQLPSISIIVPARNEAGTIKKIAEELPTLGSFTEVIFVEGNSTDDTRDVIKKVAAEYRGPLKIICAVQDGKGKGDAVRKGFDMATGDILAIFDADMTVPPEEMSKFYSALVNNRGDFINGSRLVYPMEKQSMRLLNFFGNKFFSYAFSAILGQTLKDTLCGTKVIWRKDYESIKENRAFFGDFDPFGDFDLLFGAAKLNLKIVDLPVHYKDRKYGATNISRWKHGWLLLKMTWFAARKLKFR
jgi:hypothetical protein